VVHELDGVLDAGGFSLGDGLAASLHDEFAYEWPELKHGVYTYAMANRGGLDKEPVPEGFAGDVHDAAPITNDVQERIRWQHLRRDPVAYLTDGKQHVLDVMNNHVLRVRGAGEMSLAELSHEVTEVDEVLRILENLRYGA